MSNKEISEINIIYSIEGKDVNIFGSNFIENNKNICKMVIDNKEYEITNDFDVENYNNNLLKIKLKGINKITNMSYMFSECSSLISLPDISEWDTSNINDMSHIFENCSSLISLPDISKWNTSNVTI